MTLSGAFFRFLWVKVNVLYALAMVFMPKKVRVKRVNDNARAIRQQDKPTCRHGVVGKQKASDKG